jgi:phosphoglycolate phosphatase
MLKLVVFDCDGVMFDSKEANRAYYNYILEHFNHPPMDSQGIEFVHTHHVMDSIKYIFRNYQEDFEEINQYRETVNYSKFLNHMRMEPDLIDFLKFLKGRFHIAISTNRTNTMSEILEIFELKSFFGKVMTASSVVNPKPHPEAMETILAHYQVKTDETIFIGDSDIDEEHAASGKVRFIAFRNPSLKAEHHVNSFTEIQQLPIWES